MNTALKWYIDNKAHVDSLFAYKFKKEQWAEDASQELVIKLIKNGNQLKDVTKVKSFVMEVANNVFLRSYNNTFLKKNSFLSSGETPVQLITLINPETIFLDKEMKEVINKSVAAIPAKKRKKSIELFMNNEMSLSDMAYLVGDDPQSFKTHYRLGRLELKEKLEPHVFCHNEVDIGLEEIEDEE